MHNGGRWVASPPHRIPGFEARDTTIAAHTGGVAGLLVARPTGAPVSWTVHRCDILFTIVLAGAMTLEGEGKAPFRLAPGDAFVIPPSHATRHAEATPDLELLQVALPGVVPTAVKAL